MNIFVSGGAGFIGSHLVRRLLSDADTNSLVVYDNFTSGKIAFLEELVGDSRLHIVEGDLKNLEDVTKAMSGCEKIYHLAANPDIAKAATEPSIDFWKGTYLTQNVLEAMRTTRARVIFYTSGSGVYGENSEVSFGEGYGPCMPISTYGASKLACESLISSYCHMFGITGRAFRFANVVGPRQTHGVGYDFVRRLKKNPTTLRILGDGTQSKSYIHVEDILNAIFTVEARCREKFDVFNVATGDYVTVREIADLAAEVAVLDAAKIHYEFTGSDRGWKGDVPIVRFDCSKILSTGWKCMRNSKQALRDSMKAMLAEISHE